MILSMTGFGTAEGKVNDSVYEVEIKTVNSRYYKARIKLPDVLYFLEDEIDRLLKSQISRGTVNYSLKLKESRGENLFDIDENVLKFYMDKLKKTADSAGLECEIDIAALLNLPGVIGQGKVDRENTKIKELIISLSKEAIKRLKQMRLEEGASIESDLKNNCEMICGYLKKIRELSQNGVVEYHKKLKKKVDALLAEVNLKLDQETLAREVAVYSERIDICEELSRLESHLNQFEKSCNLERQTGRRLDFIAQEMLREANTICSKANNEEITNLVVEIKCCIERIKEQIQNIE
ncbi:MAG: YicC family protein [Phycisphaerae bacterium]|nr:YicC family protein [Phycisphaerae bacterium]